MVSNQYLEFSIDKCDTISSSKTPQKNNLTNFSIKVNNRDKLGKKADKELLRLARINRWTDLQKYKMFIKTFT